MRTASNSKPEQAKEGLQQVLAVNLSIASAEDIRGWSKGEVTRPLAFDPRTKMSVGGSTSRQIAVGGLLCEKIFGPVASYRCRCGKYRGDGRARANEGTECDHCGVLIADSNVRRYRMGHIELASPVIHPYFYRGTPSILSVLFQEVLRVTDEMGEAVRVTRRWLEEVIRGDVWVNANVDSEDSGSCSSGAFAIREWLRQLGGVDVPAMLRSAIKGGTNHRRSETLGALMALFESDAVAPESMVLDVLPVIPPVSRQITIFDETDHLGNERVEVGDLNRLYGRVIRTNNALREHIEEDAPPELIYRRQRTLQKVVNALLENESLTRPVKNLSGRPLGSITGVIKGKSGRLRNSLLGKRVDYSGRAVIVVNPKLRLWECGLPEKIAWKLFKPMVQREMEASKRQIILNQSTRRILIEVMSNHPVMLNRAPTLHRMNVQSFYPVLSSGNAIEVHPLICKSFNADFDGDQMAVHLPLSIEAQVEAAIILASHHNLLSPANGKIMFQPSQDMVMGLYYLTMDALEKGNPQVFSSDVQLEYALEIGKLQIWDPIYFRLEKGRKIIGAEGKEEQEYEASGRVLTTAGRAFFNCSIGGELPFYNVALNSSILTSLLEQSVAVQGHALTVRLAERLAEIGLKQATRCGVSIGVDDLIRPPQKDMILAAARHKLEWYKQQLDSSENFKREYLKTWMKATDDVAKELMSELKSAHRKCGVVNPLFLMVDSGARGGLTQVKQLAGMRGLISTATGDVSSQPITSNFREGLTLGEYFVSTHGSRKSFSDIGLKTAEAGYITRRLVQAAGRVVVTSRDCGTKRGVLKTREAPGDFANNLRGRVSLQDVRCRGKLLLQKGDVVTAIIAREVAATKRKQLRVRSPLTCEAEQGICQCCYGEDLSTGRIVELGTAVGVIAGQSIGEPGTQLTMHSKHSGGIVTDNDIVGGLGRVEDLLEARCNVLQEIVRDGTKREVSEYLLRELRLPYLQQGVDLDEKHFEIVIREMMGHQLVVSNGDTGLVMGTIVERRRLTQSNAALPPGGKKAIGKEQFLGISRVGMAIDSFLSTASFREPRQVLRLASLCHKRDALSGITERVIVGGLIPAGTGFEANDYDNPCSILTLPTGERCQKAKAKKPLEVRVLKSPRESGQQLSLDELLAKLRAGPNDKMTWNMIIAQCWDRVFTGIRNAEGIDEIIARRLTSRVLNGVAKSQRRFPSQKAFWKFLWQRRNWIVKNYQSRELKRRKRERQRLREMISLDLGLPDENREAQQATALIEKMSEEAMLTDKQRQVFNLAWRDGFSDDEIAIRLKRTNGAIRRAKAHIKKKLRNTPTAIENMRDADGKLESGSEQ